MSSQLSGSFYQQQSAPSKKFLHSGDNKGKDGKALYKAFMGHWEGMEQHIAQVLSDVTTLSRTIEFIKRNSNKTEYQAFMKEVNINQNFANGKPAVGMHTNWAHYVYNKDGILNQLHDIRKKVSLITEWMASEDPRFLNEAQNYLDAVVEERETEKLANDAKTLLRDKSKIQALVVAQNDLIENQQELQEALTQGRRQEQSDANVIVTFLKESLEQYEKLTNDSKTHKEASDALVQTRVNNAVEQFQSAKRLVDEHITDLRAELGKETALFSSS